LGVYADDDTRAYKKQVRDLAQQKQQFDWDDVEQTIVDKATQQ